MFPYFIYKLLFWVGATTVCGDYIIPTFSEEHVAHYKGKQLRRIRFEEYTPLGNSILEGKHQINLPFTTLKVLSYNVLSQTHLIDHMRRYRVNDPKALLWDVRSRNLLKEIQKSYADVLCLQEVEKNHIMPFYRRFEEMGYTGFYSHRGGDKPDGCAIFYKVGRFNVSDMSVINYFKGNGTLLDRHNSAIAIKLEFKRHPGNYIVIVTTHLLYNQNRQDVKLGQMQILLAEIDRIASKGNNVYYPVILTGDFNIPPDSGIIKLIKSQELRYLGLSGRTLNPNRNPGFGIYLGSELLPPCLGIEDICQYEGVREAKEKGLPDPRRIKNLEEYMSTFDIQNIDNMTVFPPAGDMDLMCQNVTENKQMEPVLNLWEAFKHWITLRQYPYIPLMEKINETDPHNIFVYHEDQVNEQCEQKQREPVFNVWEVFKHWLTLRQYPNTSLMKKIYNQYNMTKDDDGLTKLRRLLLIRASSEEESEVQTVTFSFLTAIKKWITLQEYPQIEPLKTPYKSHFRSTENDTYLFGQKRYGTGILSHKFRFSSVYNHPILDKHEQSFSENKDRFKQKMFTYDYIFYTGETRVSQDEFRAGDLYLLSRLRMPTVDEFHRFLHPIPNSVLGSDHLSLTATFLLYTE